MTHAIEVDDLEAFRMDARRWIDENLPASLRNVEDGSEAPPEGDARHWARRIAERGWAAPTWPTQYGGGGLNAAQARSLNEELTRAGASNPFRWAMGVTMVGPTILDYGTEAQKQKFLPPIARGEASWCIGYSEPGAGSDLASLQTRCEDAGDHWLINGQKLWTSGADHADWCGCLVRTDPRKSKHEGISFVLVDMRQPGVETRPIKLISGASSFCETFFNDAIAAKDALLGKLDEGWTVGKRLLQHERAAQTGTTIRTVKPEPLPEIATRRLGRDDQGRLVDADLRSRLVRHEMDARAHGLTIARSTAESRAAKGATQTASMLKSAGAALGQERAELILEILGAEGGAWEGDAFSTEALQAQRDWLLSKAMTIYGGSAEVQNNIIAKRILGLPDTSQSG